MKFTKLFALIPVLAILVGCGGKGGDLAGPSTVVTQPSKTSGTQSVSEPQVVVTSDGVPVEGASVVFDGGLIRVTAAEYVSPRIVRNLQTSTQAVDLWKIPEGWGQGDVVDLVYADTWTTRGSRTLYPLSTPNGRPIVFSPAAGTSAEDVQKLRDAAGYWTSRTGYDFHILEPGESTVGKAVFTFAVDPTLLAREIALGTTLRNFDKREAIVGGVVTVMPQRSPDMEETIRHELGHTFGLNHVLEGSLGITALMAPSGGRGELTQGELQIVNKMRNRPVGTVAVDTDPGLTAAASSVGGGTRTFICGRE